MESKGMFESIIKAKMEGLEKAPSAEVGKRLQYEMQKQIQGNPLWKKVVMVILIGSIVGSLIWYLSNLQSSITPTINTTIASQKEENLKEHNIVYHQQDHFGHEHQGHLLNQEDHHEHIAKYDRIHPYLKRKYNSISIKGQDNIKNSSFIRAKAQAIQENKLIFLNVYNLDCNHCQKMRDSTFADPSVQTFLKDDFVRMDIDYGDFKQNAELIKYYDIKTVPTFLFVNGQGKLISKIRGSRDPNAFIKSLEKVLEREAGMEGESNNKAIKIVLPKDVQLASYQAALKKAKDTDKLIFIDFYKKDCKSCQERKDRTLGNREVQRILADNFITLSWEKKDDLHKELLTLYKNPNLLFIDNEGNWLTKLSTYTRPDHFIKLLNDLINEEYINNKELLIKPNINVKPPKFLKTTVFPNPSSGLFHINIKGKPQPIQINIFQTNGQLIYEDRLTAFLGEQTIEFDLSRYKGQFTIQVLQGKEIVSSTVIIQ